MLYRQKFDTFIRSFGDVGYIINKGNNTDSNTNASGAIFLKALSRTPRSLQDITSDIANVFTDVERTVLEKDIVEFYDILERDGFIVSGENEAELDRKDIRFSYSDPAPKTNKKDFTQIIGRAEENTQFLLENKFKKDPYLTVFQFELTSRCNERCIHCYIPHEYKLHELDPTLFYDVLDQCRDMGVLTLNLSGGEPLLHKNFLDFLRKAKEYDFSINILSNLTLINDEIVAEMKATRLSSVQVSLYSMDAAIHDFITKLPGSFEKTKNAILHLIENDIPLQISCPTMKQNKNCFSGVLNWAQEHKCRAITDYNIMARYDHTTSNLDNRLNLDEIGKVINDIINNDIDYQQEIKRVDFRNTNQRDRSNDIVCGVCVDTICTDAKGDVYPCPGWQDYILGNLRDMKLRDIWENAPRVKYLRSLRRKDFIKCTNCADKPFCAMCMLRNANENPEGDIFKIPEHFCKVAALNRQIVLDWKEKLQKETVL